MIPKRYINEWKFAAPWPIDDQVEQDLIICRALVALFSDEFLSENLAFRGGTALHKLYLNPPPRYSEDIDLVQIKEGPIKPILQRIGEVITFFEEDRVVKPKALQFFFFFFRILLTKTSTVSGIPVKVFKTYFFYFFFRH